MVAPRALVFRPLVKGNEDSGNEIGNQPSQINGIVRTTSFFLSNLKLMLLKKQISSKFNFLFYSVFPQVQEFDLPSAYKHDCGAYSFIRKIMAPPFLPKNEIRPMFYHLQRQAPVTLQPFTEYVSSTYTTWGPSDWTVFTQAVRTNNEVEGWPHGLDRRASGRGQLHLCLLSGSSGNPATLTILTTKRETYMSCKTTKTREENVDGQKLLFVPGEFI